MIVLILFCNFRNATTMLRPVTTLVPRILLGDDHGQTYSGNCSFIWSREHPWSDAYARDDAPFILGRRTHLNVGNKLTICRYWCCYCWANCYCATISSVSISGSFVLFMISLSSRSLKTKRSLYWRRRHPGEEDSGICNQIPTARYTLNSNERTELCCLVVVIPHRIAYSTPP